MEALMAITPNLGLPIIAASQAQKHVTHNESLVRLDAMVQLAVLSAAITAPPASPSNGARYIVPTGATGAWAGNAGMVAVWSAGAWTFYTPGPGWSAWNIATGELLIYDGTEWTAFSGGGDSGSASFDELGVGGASPDATNKFAFYGTNMLFNSGASIDATFNKNAPGNDASFTFKTAFASRALLGLLGSDDFTLKMSPDGGTFLESLVARGSDGVVRLPQGILADAILRDQTDPTKGAQFVLSGITAGQVRAFTLPNTSSEIAILAGSQTFTGSKTFSGTFTVSAATATFGNATTAATYGVGSGATVSGASKTVNIGTGGASGSTTTVNIGPSAAGADGVVNINAPVTIQGAATDPVGLPDGSMWHNTTTGQIRMVSGGNTRVVGGAMVPFTTPNSGQFIRTDSGVGTTTTTVAGAATRTEIYPWVARGDVVINGLGLNVTTAVAGALAKIVVYAVDANGRPAGRLTETGDLDLSTVGAKVATVSLTLHEGLTYFFGVRHSSTATISAWQPYTTPNLPADSLVVQAMGVYRRNIAWANAAPVTWGWNPAEAAAGNCPAIWLQIA
ncbi:hypothetical protein RCRHEA_19 [Rhodobacter phage RcRhea]|uniref:DUF2793 domain-containing protein n=1 Tax=Rhodobacter phage RcRhea TaxID=1662332 RepID=A0A0K1LM04_9CAUD|nr:hypothetical protein RCRHEA_19 [Rhodobacter phage RcRhea]AKU43263.1 hypothetical protein RCRHEA_19 [Rhodobacter phage RcRhea]